MRLLAACLLLLTAQTPAVGTATIRGTIVDKQSGAPMARAVVSLRSSRGDVNQHTLTDDRGVFEFTKLVAGSYSLQATAGEHRATHLPTTYRAADGGPTGLTLKDGEERNHITIALPRSLAVSGRVVDLEGHPLAGLQVSAQGPGTDGRGSMGRPRMTDDRGVFRMPGLAPGRYVICADGRSGPSFSPDQTRRKQYLRTCHPSAAASADAREVVVNETDVDGVEIRMQRHDTFMITGAVLAADGTPAADAVLSVMRIERSGSSGTSTTLRGTSTFTVSNVAPGRYEVAASVGGTRFSSEADEREAQFTSVSLEMSTADVEGLVLQMKRGVTLRGRVTYEDAPTDPAPQPLTIDASAPAMSGYAGSMVRLEPVRVADDGSFTLTPLFGPKVLRVNGPLPRGYVLKSIQYGGRDITDVPVEFDGAPGREAEIVLTNRTGELSGTVTDDTGAPAVGAMVVSFPADPARWKEFNQRLVPRSGKDGRFRLPQLVAGDYYVIALSPETYRLLDLNSAREQGFQRLAAVAERVSILERDRRTADLRLSTVPEKK